MAYSIITDYIKTHDSAGMSTNFESTWRVIFSFQFITRKNSFASIFQFKPWSMIWFSGHVLSLSYGRLNHYFTFKGGLPFESMAETRQKHKVTHISNSCQWVPPSDHNLRWTTSHGMYDTDCMTLQSHYGVGLQFNESLTGRIHRTANLRWSFSGGHEISLFDEMIFQKLIYSTSDCSSN